MTIIKAANHQEAEKLIRAGTAKKIELAYDIGSDDFFQRKRTLYRFIERVPHPP
ncbi:Uncharacterised protein [Acinetobacter baumannii]|nr:Uncharacterised protein [Acinetobacter baumannii]